MLGPVAPLHQLVRAGMTPSACESGGGRSGAAGRQGTNGPWREVPGRGMEDGLRLASVPTTASHPQLLSRYRNLCTEPLVKKYEYYCHTTLWEPVEFQKSKSLPLGRTFEIKLLAKL